MLSVAVMAVCDCVMLLLESMSYFMFVELLVFILWSSVILVCYIFWHKTRRTVASLLQHYNVFLKYKTPDLVCILLVKICSFNDIHKNLYYLHINKIL